VRRATIPPNPNVIDAASAAIASRSQSTANSFLPFLPSDARFKGYEPVVIQDVLLRS
jgi:hypothetical protein